MASNTRGKLKEKFEGIHRDFTWAQQHCEVSLSMIKDYNPKLSSAIKLLHKGISELDKLAQSIYAQF